MTRADTKPDAPLLVGVDISKHRHDPLVAGIHDIQELSKTHESVSRSRTELWHRILTHYLPLYFPEAERTIPSDQGRSLGGPLLRVNACRSASVRRHDVQQPKKCDYKFGFGRIRTCGG